MKKEYDFWASKRNIPNLELYTKLIGIWFFSTGLNYLFMFLYAKFVLYDTEFSGGFLAISVLMFATTPDQMTDPKKGSRDLPAVICGGVFHGLCTIGGIYVIQFWWLLVVYGIELLVVIMVIIQNFKSHRRK